MYIQINVSHRLKIILDNKMGQIVLNLYLMFS